MKTNVADNKQIAVTSTEKWKPGFTCRFWTQPYLFYGLCLFLHYFQSHEKISSFTNFFQFDNESL